MNKRHVVAVFLAFGSLAALPACSSTATSSPAPMARQELSPGMVRQVQAKLQQQGTYAGNIDGIWGPATQGAVQSYQQSHGLAANGQLDSPTLASLNMPGDSSAPTMPPAAQPATTSSAAPAATMTAPTAQATTSSTATSAPVTAVAQ